MSAFEHFLRTPGSKDLSLPNSLFSSPIRQPSTSLSGWPLQTIDEEGAHEEDLLSCLHDSTVVLQGATPQDVHAYAVKYRLMKISLPAVQLMLIDYPQFGAWEMKHEPIEKPCNLKTILSSKTSSTLGWSYMTASSQQQLRLPYICICWML